MAQLASARKLWKPFWVRLAVTTAFGGKLGRPATEEDPALPVGDEHKGTLRVRNVVETTVIDLAGMVHKDFLTGLKSARIWGSPLSPGPSGSAKYPGQSVERDHLLADGDVVELHR